MVASVNYESAVQVDSVVMSPGKVMFGVFKRRNGEVAKRRKDIKDKSQSYKSYKAMELCLELQHSHDMDYQNRTYFAMKFIHDTSGKCTLYRNGATFDVYISP